MLIRNNVPSQTNVPSPKIILEQRTQKILKLSTLCNETQEVNGFNLVDYAVTHKRSIIPGLRCLTRDKQSIVTKCIHLEHFG